MTNNYILPYVAAGIVIVAISTWVYLSCRKKRLKPEIVNRTLSLSDLISNCYNRGIRNGKVVLLKGDDLTSILHSNNINIGTCPNDVTIGIALLKDTRSKLKLVLLLNCIGVDNTVDSVFNGDDTAVLEMES